MLKSWLWHLPVDKRLKAGLGLRSSWREFHWHRQEESVEDGPGRWIKPPQREGFVSWFESSNGEQEEWAQWFSVLAVIKRGHARRGRAQCVPCCSQSTSSCVASHLTFQSHCFFLLPCQSFPVSLVVTGPSCSSSAAFRNTLTGMVSTILLKAHGMKFDPCWPMGTLVHERCSVNGSPLPSVFLFLLVSFVDLEVGFL